MSVTSPAPDGSATRSARQDFWLIALLSAVTAIGPFTLHLLAPALPQISAQFDVPPAWAQPLLSLSLVAMGIANLIWGLVLGAAGSALAAMAPELWLAVIGRLLQAAGGSAGMVLARAVAQDVFGSARSAAVIGQITAVMVVAPMIAPTISGMMVEDIGWRGIFWLAAALTALLVIWSRASLVETAPKGGASAKLGDMLRGFRIIGARGGFWRYAGYAACSLAGFYYFVGITPYVMQDAFGQGPAAYGFYFIMLSGTYMVTNFLCGPVTARFGAERTLIWGALLSFAGPTLSGALLLAGFDHPIVLFAPGMLQSLGAGLAVPNAMAHAVAAAPERAGAASGLLGASQFLLAAVTTQIGGFLDHSVALIVPGGEGLMMIVGLLGLALLRRPAKA